LLKPLRAAAVPELPIAAAVAAAARRLAGVADSPRMEAERLVAHVLHWDRSRVIAHSDQALPAEAADRFAALVERRAAGEPLAYLTGVKEFWSLTLRVTPDVLVPRPETELLVEWALEIADPSFPRRRESSFAVLDLGTGSGAIALALAKERPHAKVLATDVSAAALAVARQNAEGLTLLNVDFVQQDFFAALHPRGRAPEAFDLVVSNPPYVAEGDPHLADLRFEPAAALTSGKDGLAALRAIVAGAPNVLRPGGWLLVEHGMAQGAAVRDLFGQAGFHDVQTRRDLAGHERCTGGRRP